MDYVAERPQWVQEYFDALEANRARLALLSQAEQDAHDETVARLREKWDDENDPKLMEGPTEKKGR